MRVPFNKTLSLASLSDSVSAVPLRLQRGGFGACGPKAPAHAKHSIRQQARHCPQQILSQVSSLSQECSCDGYVCDLYSCTTTASLDHIQEATFLILYKNICCIVLTVIMDLCGRLRRFNIWQFIEKKKKVSLSLSLT